MLTTRTPHGRIGPLLVPAGTLALVLASLSPLLAEMAPSGPGAAAKGTLDRSGRRAMSPPMLAEGALIRMITDESFVYTIAGLKRVSVTNPRIADVVVIGQDEVRLDGMAAGRTSLILWDTYGRTACTVEVLQQPADPPSNSAPSGAERTHTGINERSFGYAVSPDYVVGPFDRLRVHIFGPASDQTTTAEVGRTGRLALQGAGEVAAAGVKFAALKPLLLAAARALHEGNQVSVLLVRPRVDPESPEARRLDEPLEDVPAAYELAPGDRIAIHAWTRTTDQTITAEVNIYGDLALPALGELHVGGLKRADLERVLLVPFEKRSPQTKLSTVVTPRITNVPRNR